MNKSYKSIWNEALHAWVATAEHAKARGKKSKSGSALKLAPLALAAGLALAASGSASAQSVLVTSTPGDGACTGIPDVGISTLALVTSSLCKVASAADAVASVGSGSPAVFYSNNGSALNGPTNSLALGGELIVTSGRFGTGPNGKGMRMGGTATLDAAIGTASIAIGNASDGTATRATGSSAVAIGSAANGNGNNSVAIGTNAQAVFSNALALGHDAVADSGRNTNAAIAIGLSAQAVASGGGATSGIAIGRSANASPTAGTVSSPVAIGILANAVGGGSQVAIGDNATATGTDAISIGGHAFAAGSAATGDQAIAIGQSVNAAGSSSIAMGNGAKARADNALAMGANAVANDVSSVAVGKDALAQSANSFAFGVSSRALGVNAMAFGVSSNAAANAVAIGATSLATAERTAAIGIAAQATATGATAVGNGALATNDNAVALGSSSTTAAANPTTSATVTSSNGGTITYGGFQGTSPASVVSVGSPGSERQVTNVAAGRITSTSTDAINGSQLYATNAVVGNVAKSVVNNLGGTTVLNTDGTITGATYNVAGNSYTTVYDAIQAAGQGWNLQANGDAATNVAPGGKVQLIDGTNIDITRSGTDVTIATSPNLTADSLTINGGPVINGGGITMGKGDTLDMGGNQIHGVAAGTSGTDAVNLDQLNGVSTIASKGWNVTTAATGTGTATGTAVTNVAPGDTATFTAGNNIAITQNGKEVQIATSMTPSFTSLTTTGDVSVGGALTVTGPSTLAGGATINGNLTLGAGTVVNMGGNQIHGVADGTSTTDAVNLGQLERVSGVASQGWNVTTAATGSGVAIGTSLVNVGPGGTATYTAGDNMVLTQSGTNITFAVSDAPSFTTVTIGGASGTVIDGSGITTGGGKGPSLTTGGINAGGMVISDVAAGSALTDAVNVDQLNRATGAAANKWILGSQTTSYTAPVATGVESTAVGSGAVASGNNSVAVGTGATASTPNSVALGNGSTTTAAVGTSGTTIQGNSYSFAGANPSGVVSMGSAGNERQVQNVAAGQLSASSTDAVNGSQLYATNQAIEAIGATAGAGINVTTAATGTGIAIGTSVANVGPGGTATYTAGNNMVLTQSGTNITFAVSDNPSFNSVTVGGTTITNNGMTVGSTSISSNGVSIQGGPSMTTSGIDAGGQAITNVAPGVNGTDAVNVNQLNAGLGTVSQNVNALRTELAATRKDANAGTAGAMAMAGMPQAYLPGKSMFAAGAATYEGQTAIAIGLSKISDNGKWVTKITGSANSRGKVGAAVGVGYQW